MSASIATQVQQSPAINSKTGRTRCKIGAVAAREMPGGLGAALATVEAWEPANILSDLLG